MKKQRHIDYSGLSFKTKCRSWTPNVKSYSVTKYCCSVFIQADEVVFFFLTTYLFHLCGGKHNTFIGTTASDSLYLLCLKPWTIQFYIYIFYNKKIKIPGCFKQKNHSIQKVRSTNNPKSTLICSHMKYKGIKNPPKSCTCQKMSYLFMKRGSTSLKYKVHSFSWTKEDETFCLKAEP